MDHTIRVPCQKHLVSHERRVEHLELVVVPLHGLHQSHDGILLENEAIPERGKAHTRTERNHQFSIAHLIVALVATYQSARTIPHNGSPPVGIVGGSDGSSTTRWHRTPRRRNSYRERERERSREMSVRHHIIDEAAALAIRTSSNTRKPTMAAKIHNHMTALFVAREPSAGGV